MFLQRITKHILLLPVFAALTVATAQPFQTRKYSTEYNPYFKFTKFERGEKSEVLAKKLDLLEAKEKSNWTINDSIDFAEISLLTQNIQLSKYYLEKLEANKHLSKYAVRLLLMDCYLERDFKKGNTIVQKHFNLHNQEDKFFVAIFKSHQNFIQNNVVDSLIFHCIPQNITGIKKGSESFSNEIIKPLERANEALKFYVKFIHEDDPIIARAFNEIGRILEEHVSLNQAYIAYSIARIYNTKDKEILDNVKQIKAKHVAKNYNTPKFRTYFPRIEDWRFDYEILKEKIIQELKDTIPKTSPNLLAPKKEKPPIPVPVDMLIPIGIGFILLLFAIFTRIKKK